MWDRYELDRVAEEVLAELREYNPCHNPNDGKFCSARGGGSLTPILGRRYSDPSYRDDLAQIARTERFQRRTERQVARAHGRQAPGPVTADDILDEYRATRRQRAYDREYDVLAQRVRQRLGDTGTADYENVMRAGRSAARLAQGNKGIGSEFFKRAARGGEMTSAEYARFEDRVAGRRRRRRSGRTRD